YVDGHWDVDALDELMHRLLRAGNGVPYAGVVERLVTRIGGRFFNRQAGSRGTAVSRHYDTGNDLYEAMLDPLMNYRRRHLFEHVGHKTYPLFFDVARRVLTPDGLLLLHTIGGSETETSFDPWTERNIFPNTMLPSARQITDAVEGRFVVEDWHNFGADYDRT